MERTKDLNNLYRTAFIYIIFAVGIFGHLYSPLRALMLTLTPATLLITGAVVFFEAFTDKKSNLLYWGILTYILTFTLEAIGVNTGFIFGNYKYGEILGLSIFSVPVIIGFNWVMVILGAVSIAKIFFDNIALNSFSAALLAVIFDFILEPIAIRLNYWNWENNVIPAQNYIAWFVIAFISSLIFYKLKVKIKSSIFIHYFFVQLIFFITLLIFFR
jgi:putative membrane protein